MSHIAKYRHSLHIIQRTLWNVALSFLFFSGTQVHAQDVPDITGTWKGTVTTIQSDCRDEEGLIQGFITVNITTQVGASFSGDFTTVTFTGSAGEAVVRITGTFSGTVTAEGAIETQSSGKYYHSDGVFITNSISNEYGTLSGNTISLTQEWQNYIDPITGIGISCSGTSQIELTRGCDFSSEPGIERCFGGIGNQCEGFPLQFFRDENTCLVQGWMSVGSILHDRCCIETNNTGAFCANPRTLRCLGAFLEAASNVRCGRFWPYTFGPYPAGNTGDDTDQDLRAPVGTRVRLNQQTFCPSGRCRVNARGRTIIRLDNCGIYCECE